MSHFPDQWVHITQRKIQQETANAQFRVYLNLTKGLPPSLHLEPPCFKVKALTLVLLDVWLPVQGKPGVPLRASGAFLSNVKLLLLGDQGVQVLDQLMKDYGQRLRMAAGVQMIMISTKEETKVTPSTEFWSRR